jgi:hypothetical protein
MSSATAIRKALKKAEPNGLLKFIPSYTTSILENAFRSGWGPVFIEDFTQTILCILRSMTVEEISKIMDVNEGLEYKIKKAYISSGSLEQLIEGVKSKRYTETRIRRILIHSMLGLHKSDLTQFKDIGGPQYIRVLGFSAVKGGIGNIFDVLFQSIELTNRELLKSRIIEADILIKPYLPDIDPSRFDQVDECAQEGYDAAKAAIPEIKKIISEKIAV